MSLCCDSKPLKLLQQWSPWTLAWRDGGGWSPSSYSKRQKQMIVIWFTDDLERISSGKKKKRSLMWHLLETKSINILYLYDFVFCVITYEMKLLSEVSLVGDDALCKLADMDEKQWEGEDPSQVVAGEMKPCVMMDLHLGALTAPTWERQTDKQTRQTLLRKKKNSLNEGKPDNLFRLSPSNIVSEGHP